MVKKHTRVIFQLDIILIIDCSRTKRKSMSKLKRRLLCFRNPRGKSKAKSPGRSETLREASPLIAPIYAPLLPFYRKEVRDMFMNRAKVGKTESMESGPLMLDALNQAIVGPSFSSRSPCFI